MAKRKQIKLRDLMLTKYHDGGGIEPVDYAAIGTMGADLWNTLDAPDQYGRTKNAVGRGALSGAAAGAAAGTAILPGWGTAIGAVVGGIGGAFKGNKQKEEAAKAKRIADSMTRRRIEALSNSRLVGYDMLGTAEDNMQMAKFGGELTPLSYATGGKLKRLASDIYEAEGRTHDEGGIKFPNEGVEIEDEETISGDYVFSDYLGFADRHKKIAKQLGKIEKKPLTRATRVSVEILRKKEEALKQEQEQIKQALGLGDQAETLEQFAHGGKLKLFKPAGRSKVAIGRGMLQLGGSLTDPDYIPPQSTTSEYQSYLDKTLKGRQVRPQADFKTEGISPEELAKVYDVNTYTRDNYNKWKTAWDSGQDVPMDKFGISEAEAREFGMNPYLKQFNYYEGKPNDLMPNVAGMNMMVAPQFYDRNPLVEANEIVEEVKLPSPVAKEVIAKKQVKPYKPTKSGMKLSFRPDVNRVGFRTRSGKVGHKTLN